MSRNINSTTAAELLNHNVRDYSRAVLALTWQRSTTFLAVAVLTGWYFDTVLASLFFSICMLCEVIDLSIARRARHVKHRHHKSAVFSYYAYLANTVISAVTISSYAVWVGITEDGSGKFTALFCLFAGALFAAMNNHQISRTLAIRLTLYGASFLLITGSDLWIYRPPLTSHMWMEFFIVGLVGYFLIDCSFGFLRLYRQDLKRLRDLQAQHDRVKESLVVRSEFVSAVSHELRTPLTSIKGSLDMINSGGVINNRQNLESLLDIAGRNTDRLASLVDDLLDLQKIEEGKMRFTYEELDVSSFLIDAVKSHQGYAVKHDVTFLLNDLSNTPTYIYVDADRLMQVLGNLMSNAAKFSTKGSEVEVSLLADDGEAQISVCDHGIGIPDGAEEDVFGRFTQIDGSDRRSYGGTGLGLNISRDIVQSLGGTIEYKSQLGEGSVFSIRLPCSREPGSFGSQVETVRNLSETSKAA